MTTLSHSLTERAMLVNCSISAWSARKHDRKISDEVATQHHAKGDVGRYNKILVPKEAMKEINAIVSQAKVHHYTNTLPWSNDGARILPSMNYFPYMEAQRAFREQFEAAVAEFLVRYPDHIEAARARLNGMFREEDYPSPKKMAKKFEFSTDITPMPDEADFRVAIGDEEQERIRAEISDRLKSATDTAIRDLWQRVHDAVSHMHERLTTTRIADGEVKPAIFKDSMVTNLRELVELLPRLNLTGDANLEAMRQTLETKLCAYEPEALRENDGVRQEAARNAASILEAMAGYVGSDDC